MSFNIGYGSSFSTSPDGSTYTPIAQINDITAPGIEVKEVDISWLGMATRWKLFMAGLGDGGEVEIQLIFDKTQMAFLLAQMFLTMFYKIQLSDLNVTASTWTFGGFIKGVKNQIPLEDKIMATFTFKVSGPPVFVAGT